MQSSADPFLIEGALGFEQLFLELPLPQLLLELLLAPGLLTAEGVDRDEVFPRREC